MFGSWYQRPSALVHGADVEVLLHVGRRRRVVRGRQALSARRMVPAVHPLHRMPGREPVGDGQGEERVPEPPQVVHEAVRHAMADDREESDLPARVVDGRRDAPTFGHASPAGPGEIDDGNVSHARASRRPTRRR